MTNQLEETRRISGRGWRALTALLALTLGAACSESQPASNGGRAPSSVEASYDALATRLLACSLEAKGCVQQAGGDEALELACAQQLESCREQARAELEALQDDLQMCVDEARECAQTADGGGVHALCGGPFRECVSTRLEAVPLPPCLAQLRACVEAGGSARSCAREVPRCIFETYFQGPDPDADGGVDETDGDGDVNQEDGGSPEPTGFRNLLRRLRR